MHHDRQEAMAKEYDALVSNQIWEVVELLPRKKTLPCKRVYKIKYKTNKSAKSLKAKASDKR